MSVPNSIESLFCIIVPIMFIVGSFWILLRDRRTISEAEGFTEQQRAALSRQWVAKAFPILLVVMALSAWICLQFESWRRPITSEDVHKIMGGADSIICGLLGFGSVMASLLLSRLYIGISGIRNRAMLNPGDRNSPEVLFRGGRAVWRGFMSIISVIMFLLFSLFWIGRMFDWPRSALVRQTPGSSPANLPALFPLRDLDLPDAGVGCYVILFLACVVLLALSPGRVKQGQPTMETGEGAAQQSSPSRAWFGVVVIAGLLIVLVAMIGYLIGTSAP